MQYFEDLVPGTKANFGSYEVTREEVIEFASKYDPQPFHLDDEAAAKTHFGRIAASGWHSCSMTMRMIADFFRDEQRAVLGAPGVDNLRWLRPVYPGDTLRVAIEVKEVTPSRSKPDIGSFRTDITTFNQNDEPVLTMTSIVLIRRRPESA